MSFDDLKELTEQNVFDYIVESDHVTFPELGNAFKDFSGDHQIGAFNKNIILWSGVSQKVVDIIVSLQTKKKIRFQTGGDTMLCYAIDGGMLNLPVAKKERPYKAPHWLPVLIRPCNEVPEKA